MLKKIIGKVLKSRQSKRHALPCQYHRIHLPAEHTPAAQVIEKLLECGYEAYLVGGAVRDFLLHVSPKDFDVATNATPEQVSKLFRRSRVIGKRFPIVHVMVGRDTIEVSTFRSGVARQNEFGRIVKDNAYGTLEQDAVRRDFTCNALYYDLVRKHIIDFHRGLDDIAQKRLVMIGDPAERYQEDPVRMLRAVRLAGKLDFEIEPNTAAPIAEHAHLLQKEPVARLFDELMKIIFSGQAQSCLKQMKSLGVRGDIHDLLTALLETDNPIAHDALAQTDWRLQQGKSVSMGFILSALFWDDVRQLWLRKQENGMSHTAALQSAIHDFRENGELRNGIPQRYSITMREIWALQSHFEYRRGGKPHRLLSQARFRAAYDFLLIRAKFGEVPQELADWWTVFQDANEATRHKMVDAQNAMPNPHPSPRKKPRKRKRVKKLAAE